ncbi:MAG: CheR family methyltransferase [Acidobacteriota bacterium]|nr:CheR family methyltransferase [Acidobacteriota bacterium]
MIAPVLASDLERFRRYVGRRLGLLLEGPLAESLERVLYRRLTSLGMANANDYLVRLEEGVLGSNEERELATLLTVGETHFFRNREQFSAFTERVIPELLESRPRSQSLRILSAGCASGEEPYSLAMVMAHYWPALLERVEITGLDLDGRALDHAQEGSYSRWSLRSTPEEMQHAYFRQRGDRFILSPRIRSMVRLEQRNLAHEDGNFFGRSRFDVIFCRNVIIYFRFSLTRDLIQRFSRSLEPDGFLFLGHTETLRGISQDFQVEHTHGTFYYRRQPAETSQAEADGKDSTVARGFRGDTVASGAVSSSAPPRRRLAGVDGPGNETAAVAEEPGEGLNGRDRRARVLELMNLERFDQALELAEELARQHPEDVDSWTLLAVLLTNRGDVARARLACREIQQLDGLHAGARYLLALCAELEGDLREARRQDETALHLDQDFTMAHLHLGRLAMRRGDSEQAQEHLEKAERLLAGTESAQLLLYGGGFRREALVELCRAQLATLEETGLEEDA